MYNTKNFNWNLEDAHLSVKILTEHADQGHSCSDWGDKIKALCLIPIDNRTSTSQGKYILSSCFFSQHTMQIIPPTMCDSPGAYSHPSQEVKLKTGFCLFLSNASSTCATCHSSKATYWKKTVVSHKICHRSQFTVHDPSTIQGTHTNQTTWDYLIHTYICTYI